MEKGDDATQASSRVAASSAVGGFDEWDDKPASMASQSQSKKASQLASQDGAAQLAQGASM